MKLRSLSRLTWAADSPSRAAWTGALGLYVALCTGCAGGVDSPAPGANRSSRWYDPEIHDGGAPFDEAKPGEDPARVFTIAVLPDTQNYYGPRREPLFRAQASWLAESAESLNLKLVAHVGDLVHEAWREDAWDAARQAMLPLEGRVPYVLAPGNHDYGTVQGPMPALDRSTLLHAHFPLSLFEGMPTFGGGFEEGERVDNSFHLFSAGGEDWLVMALEFGPRDAVVAWANTMLDAYPERRVIVVTHAYMFTDGQRYDWVRRGTAQKFNPHSYGVANLPGGVHDGEELWRDLLAGRTNLVAVLCGHAHGDGATDPAHNGVARNIDAETGVAQLLANYQDGPDGGQGYLRLLRFDPQAREVHVTTYSPALDLSLDDDENDFSFAY